MGKIGGVEIHSQAALLAPADPTGKMGRVHLVAINFFAVKVAVAGVKVEPMGPRNERKRLVKIGSEFLQVAGFARIIPGHLNASCQFAAAFKSSNIIALPAMERNRNGRKRGKSGFGINPKRGVGFLSVKVGGHGKRIMKYEL